MHRKLMAGLLSGLLLFGGFPSSSFLTYSMTNEGVQQPQPSDGRRDLSLRVREALGWIDSAKGPETRLREVQMALVQGQRDEALRLIKESPELDRENVEPKFLLSRGTLLLLLGETTQGSSDLEFVIANAKGSAEPEVLRLSKEALARLETFYSDRGDKEALLELYGNFSQALPDSPIGYLGKGSALMQLGDAGSALEAYKIALEKSPISLAAYTGITEAAKAMDSEAPVTEEDFRAGAHKAIEELKVSWQDQQTVSQEALEQALETLQYLKDREGLKAIADKLVEVNPDHLGACRILAETRVAEHNPRGALEILEKISVAKRDEEPWVLRKMASLYRETGQSEQGLKMMETLGKNVELTAKDHYLTGLLASDINDVENAVLHLDKACSGKEPMAGAKNLLDRLRRKTMRKVTIDYKGLGDSDEFSRSCFSVSMDRIDFGRDFLGKIGFRSGRLVRDLDLDEWAVLMNATKDGVALNSTPVLPVSLDFQRFIGLHALAYEELNSSGLDISLERDLGHRFAFFGAHTLDSFGGEADIQDGYTLGLRTGETTKLSVYYSRRPQVETQLGADFALHWDGFGVNVESRPHRRLLLRGEYEKGDISSSKTLYDITLADNGRSSYSFEASYQLLEKPGLTLGLFADKMENDYTPDLNSFLNFSYVAAAPYNGARVDVNPFLPVYYSPVDLSRTGLGLLYRNSSRPRLNYGFGFRAWDCSDGDLEKEYTADFSYAMNKFSDFNFKYLKHRKDHGYFTTEPYEADSVTMSYASHF